MFRDRESELQRLQEALLAEEEEQQEDEELLQVDTAYAQQVGSYQIYNTDRADNDLEECSEDVYRAEKTGHTGLWVALLLISLLALGFLGGWLFGFLGVG